jgi:hypothetical protein
MLASRVQVMSPQQGSSFPRRSGPTIQPTRANSSEEAYERPPLTSVTLTSHPNSAAAYSGKERVPPPSRRAVLKPWMTNSERHHQPVGRLTPYHLQSSTDKATLCSYDIISKLSPGLPITNSKTLIIIQRGICLYRYSSSSLTT